MIILIFSILGLSFGSFISMLSYRLPLNLDIFYQRSHCTSCKQNLGFLDLVPLFSWLANNGKCRYCGAKIHFRYPLIEISTAFLFLFTVISIGINIYAVTILALIVILITMSVIDFEHYIIPDSLQVILLIIALIWSYLTNYPFDAVLLSASCGFLSSYIIAKLFKFFRKKEGLGFGDVKFITIAAIFLGYKNLVFFYLLSGLFGVANGLIWQHLFKKSLFPFGPSLALSLFLCLIIPFFFSNIYISTVDITDLIIRLIY